jgi:hypothetical protein
MCHEECARAYRTDDVHAVVLVEDALAFGRLVQLVVAVVLPSVSRLFRCGLIIVPNHAPSLCIESSR